MSQKVGISEVISNLQETDQTGDKDWVKGLISDVKAQGKKWKIGQIKISEIESGNTSEEDDLIDTYGSGINDFPPVVLIPSDDPEFKWYVIDGGHRVATLDLYGKKTVRAYYPDLDAKAGEILETLE